MSLFDDLQKFITPDTIGAIAGALGKDEQATGSVVSAALPTLISALAKNSAKPEGAQALDRALEKDHDGGILDDIGGFLASQGDGGGAGILKHVLGAKQQKVEAEIGKKSGIDAADVGKVLVTVAPLIMGLIGKKKREEGLDAAGVAQRLGAEQERANAEAPEPNFLSSLLDTDKDGSIEMDEIASKGAKVLGALLG